MRTVLFAFLPTACLLFFSTYLPTRDIASIHTTVDRYVAQNGFSGTILVAKNGDPVYHQSFGLAYYATPDTIRNDYHYSIASITKLFTAIRILQLVEDDILELDTPVVEYLPQYKSLISEKVTAHHLLLHISGLPKEKGRVYRRMHSPSAIVRKALSKNKPQPFGQFNYNNVDYLILGLLIEERTDRTWEKEIRECILQPANLEQTGFLEYGYYPKNFAYTYSKKWNGLRQDPLLYMENFFAAGNMYATSIDLLRLDQALYSNTLLNDSSKDLLAQSFPEYGHAGYSVWNYQYPFVDQKPMIMERRGKILGGNVVLVRMMEEKYTIIILSNDDRFNPDSFGDENNLREMLIRSLY